MALELASWSSAAWRLAMAFFNLTMLGPQDPIKSSLRDPDTVETRPTSTAGPFRDLRLTTPISTVRDDGSSRLQSPVIVVQAMTGRERPAYSPVTQPVYHPHTIPPTHPAGRGVTAVFSVGDTPPASRPSGHQLTTTAQMPCLTTTVPAAGRPTAHNTIAKPKTPPAAAYSENLLAPTPSPTIMQRRSDKK